MIGWFGKSWGAPCCDPEEHLATPVGQACLRCSEPIGPDAQGLTMMHVESLDPPIARVSATHLDCYLKQILPHGPDCPRCRGKALNYHALRCNHRQTGGTCTCNCIDVEDV